MNKPPANQPSKPKESEKASEAEQTANEPGEEADELPQLDLTPLPALEPLPPPNPTSPGAKAPGSKRGPQRDARPPPNFPPPQAAPERAKTVIRPNVIPADGESETSPTRIAVLYGGAGAAALGIGALGVGAYYGMLSQRLATNARKMSVEQIDALATQHRANDAVRRANLCFGIGSTVALVGIALLSAALADSLWLPAAEASLSVAPGHAAASLAWRW